MIYVNQWTKDIEQERIGRYTFFCYGFGSHNLNVQFNTLILTLPLDKIESVD